MTLVASLVNSFQKSLLLGLLHWFIPSPWVWPGSNDLLNKYEKIYILTEVFDISTWFGYIVSSVLVKYWYEVFLCRSLSNVTEVPSHSYQRRCSLIRWISFKQLEDVRYRWGFPEDGQFCPWTAAHHRCTWKIYWLSLEIVMASANALSIFWWKGVRQKTWLLHSQNCGVKYCQLSDSHKALG